MIDRPLRYVERFAKYADILGFHFEAGSDVSETLKAIKKCGCKTCLTIKPCTPAAAVFPFLDDCDMVLVMSVEPGFGGQKFMPDALDKLSHLRAEIDRRGLDTLLEVDGGVNDVTGAECVKQAPMFWWSAAIFSARATSKKRLPGSKRSDHSAYFFLSRHRINS